MEAAGDGGDSYASHAPDVIQVWYLEQMSDGEGAPERFPNYSHEQQLEDRSIDELRSLLRGAFLVRDQRARDFGVDLTIEILQDNQATNYTSMVQVKARSNLKPNTDGSFSLPIASTNINYLLSTASSIVVLYDADRSTFYWVHVLGEVMRLEAEGVNFRNQDSITLRLITPLTKHTIESLREELLVHGRATRQFRQKLASLNPNSMLHVDSSGVGVTTDDVEHDFFRRGWRLAARGELEELERMFGLLAASSRTGGRAQLLMSHAHACNGQLYAAQMYANRARRRIEDLQADDVDLLELIEIGCDRVFRRSTNDDVLRRTRVIRDRANPEMRVQLDVSSLRQEMTICADPNQFGAYTSRAAALAAESASTLGPAHPATLAARVLVQDLSSRALGIAYAHLQLTCVYGDSPLGLHMRGGVPVAHAIAKMHQTLKDWFTRNNTAKQDCAEWPLLALELEKGELLIQTVLLRNTRLMGVTERKEPKIDLTYEPISTLLASITALRDRAQRMGVDDVEVQARLLRAEVLDLSDAVDEMRREANELVARARASGFERIEEEARAFAEGRSMFRLARAQMMKDLQYTSDEQFVAHEPPERREEIADGLCDVLRLPPRSRDIVRDQIERIAAGYQLRETFCRHFEILEEDVDDDAPYARRSSCICVCARRGIRTMLKSPYWQALIAEFRRNYCDGCSLRDPAKIPASSTM